MGKDTGWLTYIRKKWSSKEPRDRVIGWIGKLVIEGGLFLIVATVIALFIYLAFYLVFLTTEISIQPLDVALTVWVSALGLLFNKSFCSIITDE